MRFDHVLLSSGVYRTGSLIKPGDRDIRFYRDGRTATVTAATVRVNGQMFLATNGKTDASLTPDWFQPCDSSRPPVPLSLDAATQTLLPLVTLEAMAEACRAATGADEVLAVLDARMGEVYWAQYRFDGGKWLEVVAPALSAPQDVTPLAAEGLRACGNGFAEYADAFAGRPFAQDALTDIMPHARELALLARGALAAGQGVPAAQAQPLYLRNKVAYTSAERQAINQAKAGA